MIKELNIKDLTLEEKVGQLLMFAFHGTEFNDQLLKQINDLYESVFLHHLVNHKYATSNYFSLHDLFIPLHQSYEARPPFYSPRPDSKAFLYQKVEPHNPSI